MALHQASLWLEDAEEAVAFAKAVRANVRKQYPRDHPQRTKLLFEARDELRKASSILRSFLARTQGDPSQFRMRAKALRISEDLQRERRKVWKMLPTKRG